MWAWGSGHGGQTVCGHGCGHGGQTEFQVNLKLGLTPPADLGSRMLRGEIEAIRHRLPKTGPDPAKPSEQK